MKFATAAVAALLAAPVVAAPITLSGNYIKVGISDYGTLGSNGIVHPGLIHDPTGTGTFNNLMDYITPGTPHEGYSLVADQFSMMQADNDYIGHFGVSSPTLLTGAAANGYSNAASWSGGSQYLNITNSYFFNDNDERILVVTDITALSDLTNLAFARSVDPDSDVGIYDVFDTNNQRGNDIFGVDDFVGSAGAITGYTLALINDSGDTYEHTTSIDNSCCSNINPYDVLNHSSWGDMGLSSSGDHGLNLAYLIGDLAQGETATLRYYYAVGERIEDTGGPTEPPVTGIPEPASWALLITGFGLIGTALRRRKQDGQPATAA